MKTISSLCSTTVSKYPRWLYRVHDGLRIMVVNAPRQIGDVRHQLNVIGSGLTQLSKCRLRLAHSQQDIPELPMRPRVRRSERNRLSERAQCPLLIMILIANYAEHEPEKVVPRAQLNSAFEFKLSLLGVIGKLQDITANVMGLSVSRRQGDGLIGSATLIRNSGQPACKIMHLVLPLTIRVLADGTRKSNAGGAPDSEAQRGRSQDSNDESAQ